ncbi:hypothetical protein ACFWGC_19155 [Cytobacillus pseudoceanisediminis]
MRHTLATLLINQSVHAKIISKRLGHSNIRITMDKIWTFFTNCRTGSS